MELRSLSCFPGYNFSGPTYVVELLDVLLCECTSGQALLRAFQKRVSLNEMNDANIEYIFSFIVVADREHEHRQKLAGMVRTGLLRELLCNRKISIHLADMMIENTHSWEDFPDKIVSIVLPHVSWSRVGPKRLAQFVLKHDRKAVWQWFLQEQKKIRLFSEDEFTKIIQKSKNFSSKNLRYGHFLPNS